MNTLRYTLLADGSSDAVLIFIINWLISEHYPDVGIQSEVAKNMGKVGWNLTTRISKALSLYPCDILFVHRDAESQSHALRLQEIKDAFSESENLYVPIIPIRMTEAWLLADEKAIRVASGNESSNIDLKLPPKKKWENLPDPKQVLFDALTTASGRSGRALKSFKPAERRARVTELTRDFSTLRGLQSFDSFESTLKTSLKILVLRGCL
jgi:hypothetical protein